MALYVWVNPNNFKSPNYQTCIANDPNVPAGYILTGGSDGAQDMPSQQYVAGINSGGFPAYTEDPSQVAAQPNWINGIFGAKPGNGV